MSDPFMEPPLKYIRMLINTGTVFHNIEGVHIGDVLTVPDQVDTENAKRYIALGYAEKTSKP